MLGIPVIPVAQLPGDAPVVFLPAQAAADDKVFSYIESSVRQGRDLVLTAGFLGAMKASAHAAELGQIAGVKELPVPATVEARQLSWQGGQQTVEPALRLHGELTPSTAITVLEADGHPFLTVNVIQDVRVWVLNSHTYSQADFDAVGEVLLPPTPLGLLEIPDACVAALREAFRGSGDVVMRGPTRVTLQPLKGAGWLIQNYNEEEVVITVELSDHATRWQNALSAETLAPQSGRIHLQVPSRSRVWIRPEK